MDDYFPLVTGDKFVYKIEDQIGMVDSPDEITVRTVGIIDTLGKKYFLVENYYFHSGLKKQHLIRKDGNNVHFLNSSSENLQYSFSPPRDSITYIDYFPDPDLDVFVRRAEIGKNYFKFKYLRGGGCCRDDYWVEETFEKNYGRTEVTIYTDQGTAKYKLTKKY